jgi:hypothetical protein
MIYFYPPVLTDAAIEYTPVKGVLPPSAHPGYRIDPDNRWRQISEWRPCNARQVGMRARKCGRALLTMYCGCNDCPLKGRIINSDDCEDCKHAQYQGLVRNQVGGGEDK